MAVKLLLGTPPPGAGGGTEELEQAADRALAEDNPIQINLQQVCGEGKQGCCANAVQRKMQARR